MHCSCYSLALGHQWEHTSWSICLLSCAIFIDGLARECGGPGASTLELLHSCAGSSAWAYKLICTTIAMVRLMAWRRIVVAPVLMHQSCCRLALGHQCQYTSCFIHMLPCYHGHIDGLAWNILEQPITIMSQHTDNHLTPDMQIPVIYLLYLLKPIVYCCTYHIVMHQCCYFSCQHGE